MYFLPLPTSLLPALTVVALALLAGCSTTQEITLGAAVPKKVFTTVAHVQSDGNSSQMNSLLEAALLKEQLTVVGALPSGTRTAPDIDALVSYSDVWRWDLVMYLKHLTVQLYDAETGQLVALGRWSDSPMHGFRDPKTIMDGLISDLVNKVRGAQPIASATASIP
ncbi:MAG: hypothetical protein U1D36_20190 [Hydrogenophaga sp.]|uniref:hypothetical protein n=1 Tax=Hydrogenophaga sp. TaxID=1904254 RepID=UPI002730155F|nr:hypothetical protein [Hydrogenophaga sp.]MDP2407428.1 hypothetical protein [Hydrogenophaga sp.]MDZ4176777.1 hypothetical protein [Hydrogenophaga sp.]